MATPTKAEIAQKIQTKILALTAPGSITKANVAEILSDLNNLAAPSVASGDAVEIYQINGRPVYKKIFLVPSGKNISAVDFSIPENHTLTSVSDLSVSLSQLASKISIFPRTVVANKATQVNLQLSVDNNAYAIADITVEGTINAILEFPDATTEEVTFEINDFERVIFEVQKDLAGFNETMEISITLLPTSTLQISSALGTFDAADYLDATATVNHDRNKILEYQYTDLIFVIPEDIGFTEPGRGYSTDNFDGNIVFFGAEDTDELKNIVITLEYIGPETP
jgi:hypothetical protein